eukprot:scaffold28164_cov65-Phaeocystis_antarctica.AAC.1
MFASGETVLQACYDSLARVLIRGPTGDGWAGAVEYWDGGTYAPLECTSGCSGGAQTDLTTSTARIFADGDDNMSGIAPATCVNGATCTLTLPPPSPPLPPPAAPGCTWLRITTGTEAQDPGTLDVAVNVAPPGTGYSWATQGE